MSEPAAWNKFVPQKVSTMMMLNAILEAIQSQGGGGGGGITEAQADARYLKLDATNGPLTGPLGITVPTQTASAAIIGASTTWNNAAVAFRGLELAITNTASASASTAVRIRGGVSGTTDLFTVLPTGATRVNQGEFYVGNGLINDYGSGQLGFGPAQHYAAAGGFFATVSLRVSQNSLGSGNNANLYPSDSGSNILEQRNQGLNPQQFRVFGNGTVFSTLAHNGTDGVISTSSGNLTLSPAGLVQFGTFNPDLAIIPEGYITIIDSGGATRKILVAS